MRRKNFGAATASFRTAAKTVPNREKDVKHGCGKRSRIVNERVLKIY
jgi:hypothetical protein